MRYTVKISELNNTSQGGLINLGTLEVEADNCNEAESKALAYMKKHYPLKNVIVSEILVQASNRLNIRI